MKSKIYHNFSVLNEENINIMNNANQNMNPRFILNKLNSNISTNESFENPDKKCNKFK